MSARVPAEGADAGPAAGAERGRAAVQGTRVRGTVAGGPRVRGTVPQLPAAAVCDGQPRRAAVPAVRAAQVMTARAPGALVRGARRVRAAPCRFLHLFIVTIPARGDLVNFEINASPRGSLFIDFATVVSGEVARFSLRFCGKISVFQFCLKIDTSQIVTRIDENIKKLESLNYVLNKVNAIFFAT